MFQQVTLSKNSLFSRETCGIPNNSKKKKQKKLKNDKKSAFEAIVFATTHIHTHTCIETNSNNSRAATEKKQNNCECRIECLWNT